MAAIPRRGKGIAAPQDPYGQTPLPAIGLFCCYVVIWFLQVGIRVPPLGKIRVEMLVAIVLIIAAVINRAPPIKKYAVNPRPVLVAVAWLLVLIAIQVPLSVNVPLSWTVFIDRVIKFAFMSVFIAVYVRSPRDLGLFLAAFLLACGFITQESFRGALSGAMVWENQGVPRLHGDTPMFAHPNSLAGVAMGVLPFAVYLFPLLKHWWMKIALLIIAATALGVVMYSGSRTSYVGLVGFLAFYVLTSKHKLRVTLALMVVLPIAWVSLPDVYRARFETIYTGQEIEGNSMGARKEIIDDAIKVFESHPLGVGVGAFPTIRNRMFGRRQDTHNLYLEVATNLGIQGFVAYLFFVGIMLKLLWRVKVRCEAEIKHATTATDPQYDHRKRAVAASHAGDLRLIRATALSVCGYLCIRLILGLFGMDLYEIYWWISLGLTVALCRMLSNSLEVVSRVDAANPAQPQRKRASNPQIIRGAVEGRR